MFVETVNNDQICSSILTILPALFPRQPRRTFIVKQVALSLERDPVCPTRLALCNRGEKNTEKLNDEGLESLILSVKCRDTKTSHMQDILQRGALTFFWAEFAHWKVVVLHNDSQGPVEIACGSAQLLCLSLQDAPLRHQLLVFCHEVAEDRCLLVHHYADYGEKEKETTHQSVSGFI